MSGKKIIATSFKMVNHSNFIVNVYVIMSFGHSFELVLLTKLLIKILNENLNFTVRKTGFNRLVIHFAKQMSNPDWPRKTKGLHEKV